MFDPASELGNRPAELAATRAELAQARAVLSTSGAMIAGLKLEIALLRREQYGHSAEPTARLLDQFEPQLEELVTAAAEDRVRAEKTTVSTFERRKPVRKSFPEKLPRARAGVEAPTSCTCCGSDRVVNMGEERAGPENGEGVENSPGDCFPRTGIVFPASTETLEGLRPFLPRTVPRTVFRLRRTGANFRASGS